MNEEVSTAASAVDKCALLGRLSGEVQLIEKIELFNVLWNEFFDDRNESAGLKNLRIHLRRLRSIIKLLEPLLLPIGKEWFGFLKATAFGLGSIREFDVALNDCHKYELLAGEREVDALEAWQTIEALLLEERRRRADAWATTVYRGYVFENLKELLHLLEFAEDTSSEIEAAPMSFVDSRLQIWGCKLVSRLRADLQSLHPNQLHLLRIRIKRFHYAYDAFLNNRVNVELLTCLKEMQDMLGSIHDGQRDVELMAALLEHEPAESRLLNELGGFKSWRLQRQAALWPELAEIKTKLIAELEKEIVGCDTQIEETKRGKDGL